MDIITSLRKVLYYFFLSTFVLMSQTIWAHSLPKKSLCCCDAHPWFVSGQLGYANYLDMFLRDAQTPVGRFAIGRNLGKIGALDISLEAGTQNGSVMRFPLHPDHTMVFGDTAPLVIKPLLDLLLTVKFDPLRNAIPLFVLFKAGPAYRRLHFLDRDSIKDEEKVSLEAHVGLGYWVNKRTTIHLSYQRIFGANPNFQVNSDGETGHINNFPTQYAVLFGITANL